MRQTMRVPSEDSPRALRAMQSFGAPRPTSNPYIHMLDEALGTTQGLLHLRFDRAGALAGRYDVIHLHWPETLLGGSTRLKRLARRVYASALMARLALDRRIAVVRTVHNVELPRDITRWERFILEYVERRADFRIRLNHEQPTESDTHGVVIPHGHYRDWFADVPRREPAPNTLGFVGLVRRYKGVEHLVEVFRQTPGELGLLVAGNPTSDGLAGEIRALAADDNRVSLDLRYLPEGDFARAVMGVSGIVLPYRFMHNSGTALAALSLDRPVLVPTNDVNLALADEVGPGWVHTYDGDLTPEDLVRFHELIRELPRGRPDLSAREWDKAGVAHLEAFRAAVRARRGGA